MDLHGASTTCDRCGAEMHTNVGVTYSDWMAKKRDVDAELHCSDCRSELSDPSERSLDLSVDQEGDEIDFEVTFDNPTEETVMFSLTDFPEGGQWNDDDRWQSAVDAAKGVVGVLEVRDVESGETVFEHVFRKWFSYNRDVPDYAMSVGGERTRTLSVTWDGSGDLPDRDRYVAASRGVPKDCGEIEVTFRLVPDTEEWPEKQARQRVVLS